MWRKAEDRRRDGQAPRVRQSATLGALRPDLQEPEAADFLWALTDPDTYRLFIKERAWAVPRYAAWLVSVLEQVLFRA